MTYPKEVVHDTTSFNVFQNILDNADNIIRGINGLIYSMLIRKAQAPGSST